MNTKPIVIVLAVIIVGFIGYYLVATRFSNEGGSSAEVSVSVFDFCFSEPGLLQNFYLLIP